MTSRRVGILGGTFDPVHCGHLDVGDAAQSALGLGEVVLITAHIPPHRPQPVASSHHRFAMVALAINGRRGWRASDIELAIGAPSYTTGTLDHFHDAGFSPTELFFITGADAFAEIESWKDFPAILDRAHFAVVSRPDFPVRALTARLPALEGRITAASLVASCTAPAIFMIDAPTADVSATAIRRLLMQRQSIAGLVPPPVRQHIEQHALYSTSMTGQPGVGAHPMPAAGRLHGKD